MQILLTFCDPGLCWFFAHQEIQNSNCEICLMMWLTFTQAVRHRRFLLLCCRYGRMSVILEHIVPWDEFLTPHATTYHIPCIRAELRQRQARQLDIFIWYDTVLQSEWLELADTRRLLYLLCYISLISTVFRTWLELYISLFSVYECLNLSHFYSSFIF